MKRRHLRSGFTTGACAAAAAKAAAQLLMGAVPGKSQIKTPLSTETSTIILPGGDKAVFKIYKTGVIFKESELIATASTIKFAGDDPDVTNGAEIIADVMVKAQDFSLSGSRIKLLPSVAIYNSQDKIKIMGGRGVGIVTKPGLSLPVGSPAINPVPQKMIRDSVIEAFLEHGIHAYEIPELLVKISVTNGDKLAEKTLNPRLGIIGGISILGTTGIVKPLSSDAWTATITASMDVAKAVGCDDVVLSAGRASEKAHMKKYRFPEEAYVMMGDYLAFSLIEAKRHEFKRIHIAAQWAKMLKIAMSTPQTHVKYGALDTSKAIGFLSKKGIKIPKEIKFNTAREIFQYIDTTFNNPAIVLKKVCRFAAQYGECITGGIPVTCTLISYEGEIICSG